MITEIEYLTIEVSADEGVTWGYFGTTRIMILQDLQRRGIVDLIGASYDGQRFEVTELGEEKILEFENEYLN